MTILAWYVVVISILGMIAAILIIGKPRKPNTPGVAVLNILFNLPMLILALKVLNII